jgi:hypothetical protein
VAATREPINRVKIERSRLSRVPVDQTATIYQGDALVWDVANKRAAVGTAASAGTFLGVSETTNPIETAGSSRFLNDLQSPRVNVIQEGLVEFIGTNGETLYPFDKVTLGADAQTVVKSGATESNYIGIVDPAVGSAGQAVVTGDLVKIWIHARPAYAAQSQAVESATA